ncbi:MAG: response regulator transcription factor [Candidatus Binataceae bacterium]|jgi:DNA-binding response OmpR family regulator
MRDGRLLIVEDEADLQKSLRLGLSEDGFTVTCADSAESAERILADQTFDAIVLDLRLPGKDGIDLLRELRAAGNQTPVLALTARGSLDDRVIGLDSGADDYLTKPFAFAELIARLRALLRRHANIAQSTLKIADLEFDTVRRRAARGGRDLGLSPKETILLELLMRNAGQPVTRTMIAEVVWGSAYNDFTNLIEVFVNRLRQKINDGAGDSLIVTVRGVGYSMRTH